MSSILTSQGVVLATAMAVSATVIFLTVSRQKTFPPTQLSENLQNSQPTSQILRSCLYSDDKKRERKKKRVQFADNVKDPVGNSEELRKQQHKIKSTKYNRSCGTEISGTRKMPANRTALYKGILRDRVHRIQCTY